MERQPHDEPAQQPSLFAYAAPTQDKEPGAAENHLEEALHPIEYYIALDRLLEALEDLIQGDYPLSDELRQRLSNPTLEALIFDEMNKSLKLKRE